MSEEEPLVDRSPRYNSAWPESVEIFDTTLRDGVQFEGISVTVDDKLRVAEQLDRLGVKYIEGGYPGANPKDQQFFERAATELKLVNSELVAFGSTRRPRGRVDEDPVLDTLANSGAPIACIVGKSWDYHVTHALRTDLDEAVAMVGDSVAFLKGTGMRVFFDAEHFFDGYKRNPEFALRVLEAAAVNGVDTLVLCDTNGGSLPHEVEAIVREMVKHFSGITIGMHTQNDTGCALSNAIAGVVAGSRHVQVTMNGYGERTGNCDITALVPNLSLKMGIKTLPEDSMELLTPVSHLVAEIMNMPLLNQQPYVGNSAFAHKAGLHTSAIARRPDSYEHIDPAAVGNGTRFLVSDLSGRASVELKATELGIELEPGAVGQVVEKLKNLENEGYHFEVADASLELLLREASGWQNDFFEVESFRVITDFVRNGKVRTEATVKIVVDGERHVAVGEGNGPVDSLDSALRQAVAPRYHEIAGVHLVDYKVRVLDTEKATAAITRVLIASTNGERSWTTIGVSDDIIAASWAALRDSVIYGLLHPRGLSD